MSAAATVAADPWLSEQLGVPAFHLTPAGAIRLPEGPSFVDAKVATSDIATVTVLEDEGFRVVDTAVTLELAGRELGSSGPSAGPAATADADGIAAIAAAALTCSRFHLDPQISDSTAAALKAAWTRSFFAGTRGEWMVVERVDDRVAGFLQLLDRPDALVIDLVAVDPGQQGRGLGRSMLAFAAQRCGTAPALRVGTQAANVGSLRFYEALGFRIVRTEHVLHRHGV